MINIGKLLFIFLLEFLVALTLSSGDFRRGAIFVSAKLGEVP